MKHRKHSKFGSSISRAILGKFLVTMVIFAMSIVVLFVAAGLILRQFTWYENNPLYEFLKAIENDFILLFIIAAFIGAIVIFRFYWRKTLGFIDTIVEASDLLVRPDVTLIQLPTELKKVEVRMNEAKQDMLRNERLAKEAEQRKNDLIVYLAHDIKTPLTSVIGYLSLLDEVPDMPAEQKARYTHITLDKAYRLEQLINEFFEITRYNLQAIVLSKKTIDLYYMLVQLADEFYPLLSANNQQVTIQADENLTVFGDPDKLARVFNNILKNASAYSGHDGVIEITAGIVGEHVSIAFTNSGSIPKEKLDAIFDKFYRLDEARSSGTGGAGLGLAIAKEIVAQHGGNIYADSDGTHATFTVELPTGVTPDSFRGQSSEVTSL